MPVTRKQPESAARPELGRLNIRWMIRRDMPEVLDIEMSSFPDPWTEDEFARCLRSRMTIGMVVESIQPGRQDRIVGFMIYELGKTQLEILNFAVNPDDWRKGAGTALINKLKGKLSLQRRVRILSEVRESNLDAQLFFRSQDFIATRILRDNYETVVEDAYEMVYQHPGLSALQPRRPAR